MATGVPAPGKAELDKAGWVVTAHIKALAVTAAKIGTLAVETAKIAAAAVTTAKLADDAVTAAKADIYLSAEITSDASAKAQAHGLGASPSVFFAVLQETGASTNPNLSASADATNVYITAASTDVKYLVFAWL